ncbi:MAG: DUF4911 domain-containing protein [Synergistes sp.]|nr:DUF4911 domain-containing protein [Synergistes sp.]
MKPEITEVHLIVPHKDIYYVSWIIDAAEGIGFLQTDDAKTGRVTVFTPTDQVDYVADMVKGLRDEGLDIKFYDEKNGEKI